MKLAILETGVPPGDLQTRFGSYPEMMLRLLGDGIEAETFDVAAGALPNPDSHDGVIIMGSPAGVYDPLPWIAPFRRQQPLLVPTFGRLWLDPNVVIPLPTVPVWVWDAKNPDLAVMMFSHLFNDQAASPTFSVELSAELAEPVFT